MHRQNFPLYSIYWMYILMHVLMMLFMHVLSLSTGDTQHTQSVQFPIARCMSHFRSTINRHSFGFSLCQFFILSKNGKPTCSSHPISHHSSFNSCTKALLIQEMLQSIILNQVGVSFNVYSFCCDAFSHSPLHSS